MAVYASNHPLVHHKTTLLREDTISVKSFRELSNEIASMLIVEATADIKTTPKPISCWSGTISAPMMDEKQPTLVPILRAGLGMLDGALKILPCAKISVVGLKRNEETLQPESYYENLVPAIDERKAIIIDPMLATGGSALATIELLKASGCPEIKAVFLVAAPEGIEALATAHPDVDIYVAAIDEKLNDKGYILPGLGDAGDKIFGTVA